MKHRPRKRFGQHFLHDPGIIQRIIAAINPGSGDPIVEIGPGQGALTIPLLQLTGTLDVVEIDQDLAHSLVTECTGLGQLHMHVCDTLQFEFCGRYREPIKVVGNLPYNISTPCLFHLLEQLHCIKEMTFMMQKEVVERICAGPGSRDYGRLSVMVQSLCAVEKLFTVGPGAFIPPPKVDSCVIRLIPRDPAENPIYDRPVFSRLVRQAFTHRRKTIRNSLRGMADDVMLTEMNIAPELRAENLSVQDYISLANALHTKNNQ